MSNTKELLNKLTNMFESKSIFYPFIEHIRFPKYKALEPNSRINFTYPVTLLVGQNGSNKTSILQALYGSPEGNSVSDYWFSTAVDGINDDKEKNCLIYGYYHEKAARVVEILKGRSGTAKGNDYWEPYAPQKQYGMERLKNGEYKKFGSSSNTRWDVLKKNVVYCDCKEYVSAFDLFFYHYDFESTKTQRTKQDFIRNRSKPLAKVLNGGDTQYSYYRKEMVDENISIDSEVCQKVSDIMGEMYSDIKILTHRFYSKSSGNKPSKTIWIKKNGKEYSEAFAGTGEARIILLVNDILNAPEKSLILIDEPEISLHPSAVYRFKNFILDQAVLKKHQIVITTHSTQLIKDFPREAIKLVSKIGNQIQITENVDYQEAFFELGDTYQDKKMIYVEDRLAKYMIDFVIKNSSSDNLTNNVVVRYLPGGAEQIINQSIVNSSMLEVNNIYYWLDGDKDKRVGENERLRKYLVDNQVVSENIPSSEEEQLGEIIKEITGVSVKFNVSGNGGDSNQAELIEKQRNYINFWKDYVSFLPFCTPELYLAELYVNCKSKDYDFAQDPNGKNFFKIRTQRALELSEVDADDIFEEQKRAVAMMKYDQNMMETLENKLNELFN